jgi:hypothetical protein
VSTSPDSAAAPSPNSHPQSLVASAYAPSAVTTTSMGASTGNSCSGVSAANRAMTAVSAEKPGG